MQVEVCVPSQASFEAARAILDGRDGFVVRRASIVDATHPCVISAGNSFGGMSGGVDGILNTHLSSFSPDQYVQELVKAAIVRPGELPVGAAVGVGTRHPRHRLLLYAPTMRVPGALPSDTIAPYLAFRSALVLARLHGVPGLSTPLFGTGAGEVPVAKACLQMLEAHHSLTTVPRLTIGDNELTAAHVHHRHLLSLG